jgi:hypothetical protein
MHFCKGLALILAKTTIIPNLQPEESFDLSTFGALNNLYRVLFLIHPLDSQVLHLPIFI